MSRFPSRHKVLPMKREWCLALIIAASFSFFFSSLFSFFTTGVLTNEVFWSGHTQLVTILLPALAWKVATGRNSNDADQPGGRLDVAGSPRHTVRLTGR